MTVAVYRGHKSTTQQQSGRGERSGGAKKLGKLMVPGRVVRWTIVGQGPIAPAVGAGCLDIFSLVYLFSFLSPS